MMSFRSIAVVTQFSCVAALASSSNPACSSDPYASIPGLDPDYDPGLDPNHVPTAQVQRQDSLEGFQRYYISRSPITTKDDDTSAAKPKNEVKKNSVYRSANYNVGTQYKKEFLQNPSALRRSFHFEQTNDDQAADRRHGGTAWNHNLDQSPVWNDNHYQPAGDDMMDNGNSYGTPSWMAPLEQDSRKHGNQPNQEKKRNKIVRKSIFSGCGGCSYR